MSCLLAPRTTDEPRAPSAEPCSWASIAAALRTQAAALPAVNARDLIAFADMLEGFAELYEG